MDNVYAVDLARAGLEWLGCGDAAIVLGLESGRALKVGYDGADGWPAWADWCRRRPGRHLPHIDTVHLIQRHGRIVAFVAVLERLRPTDVARVWMASDRLLKRDPLRLAGMIELEHPTVAAMLREAAAAFPKARWDAGPSNWMQRDDGTLVLTDPLAAADSSKV